jgi:RimJ/RimL family protein N-acetyltransferase
MIMTTRRLMLRELIAADAPFVRTLMNEPSFVEQIGDRGVHSLEDARRYIESGPWTRYATHGFGLWMVELRERGEPIGISGLLRRDALPSPDIGFAFLPRFWSNGYAFESAAAVKDFAANVLRLSEVLAIVKPSNIASIRLLEKLGFTRRPETRTSEHRQDAVIYGAALDGSSR